MFYDAYLATKSQVFVLCYKSAHIPCVFVYIKLEIQCIDFLLWGYLYLSSWRLMYLYLSSRSSFSQSFKYEPSITRQNETISKPVQNTGSSLKKSGDIRPTRIPSPMMTTKPIIYGLEAGKMKSRIIIAVKSIDYYVYLLNFIEMF